MYLANRRNCTWQDPPPVPEVIGDVDYGTLQFRKGKTVPRQCQNTEIDAHFGDYVAGHQPGTDRFTIFWRASQGDLHFRVRYVVHVR